MAAALLTMATVEAVSISASRSRVQLATVAGAVVLLCFVSWPPPAQAIEFVALTLVTVVHALRNRRRPSTTDIATMPLSFVINMTTLLLLGPMAATALAVVGAVLRELDGAPSWQAVVNIAVVVASMLTAAYVHSALGGTRGHFDWPWQAVPVAGTAVSYCVVRVGLARVFSLVGAAQAVTRSWPRAALRSAPNYILGASVSVFVVEAIDHRLWALLLVAAAPLHFLHRAYGAHLDRLKSERRGRNLIESLDQGMCAVDTDGRVTLWNEALERILGCPRARALGRSVVGAVPVLGKTDLPRAISDAMVTGQPRTLSAFMLPSTGGALTLQVKILPDADGVTLLWHDTTERSRAQLALQRSQERLTLMETVANDGLWEWNLASRELYVSARWRAVLGLPAASGHGRPEDWFDRVHADDIESLKAAINDHLSGLTDELRHEHRIRHEDGTYRHMMCRGHVLRGAARRALRITGSLTDVTEQATAQERLRSAGFRDPLTGLYNRALFVEGMGERLEEFKLRRGGRFAALYLDLDRFKLVNDSLGHLVGDELLKAVSRRLESCLREGDALARLGGDEFAILLNGLEDEAQANVVAFRIQDSLSAPFSIGGREVFTSASIGIAFSTLHYNSPEEIMRDADAAMYQAKARGKARHEVFDADMHARAVDRLGLENDLRHAVKDSEFEVHYQPIVSLESWQCVGFEALVRWKRNGQIVSPDKFIPIAEELGLIEPLGTWVMRQACRTFADWQRRFPSHGLECITVNVSTRQLMQQNFLIIVEDAVREARIEPSSLRLEITETTLMGNPYTTAETLRELRGSGVKIYLDDFGTGYSSLSHLHKLPVDALKIDRSFVHSLLLPDRPAIVESILALARTLDTSVVAEGVECDVQARELERLGCRHAQGYFFSLPLSGQGVEEMLASPGPLPRTPVEATMPPSLSAAFGIEPEVDLVKALEWPDDLRAPVPAPLLTS